MLSFLHPRFFRDPGDESGGGGAPPAASETATAPATPPAGEATSTGDTAGDESRSGSPPAEKPLDYIKGRLAALRGETSTQPAQAAAGAAGRTARPAAAPLSPPAPGQPAAVPQQPARSPLRVFQMKDEHWGDTPPEQRAALQPVLESMLAQLEQERYLPAATQVFQAHQQNQAYYQQLEEFTRTPEFEAATWLAQNPQAYEAFTRWLQTGAAAGGEAAPAQPALPEIDEASLDPETRAIFAHHRALREQAEANATELRNTVSQLQERLAGHDAHWQQQEAQQHAATVEYAGRQADALFSSAMEHAKTTLGFDPAQYPTLLQEAKDLVADRIAAGTWRADHSFSANFVKALEMAGAEKIKARLAKQARTSGSPPPDRAGSGQMSQLDYIRNIALPNARRAAG